MRRLGIFLILFVRLLARGDEPIRMYSDIDTGCSNFLAAVFGYVESGNVCSSAVAFAAFAENFPTDGYAAIAKDISIRLVDLGKENQDWKESPNWTVLPLDEQIDYHIHHLQDMAFVQNGWPDECNVITYSNLMTNRIYRPALELKKLGVPAVRRLITLLSDKRPTRCVGLWRPWRRGGWTLLRYQDVAVQVLEAIAEQEFYRRPTTSSYLSLEPYELRKAVIENATEWCRKRTEAEPPAGGDGIPPPQP